MNEKVVRISDLINRNFLPCLENGKAERGVIRRTFLDEIIGYLFETSCRFPERR